MGLPLATNLKFYTSVSKRLKLKVRNFGGLTSTFVEVTGEKLLGGRSFWPPILNRVKAIHLSYFVICCAITVPCHDDNCWKSSDFYLMLSSSMNNGWNHVSYILIPLEDAFILNYVFSLVAWDTNYLFMKNYKYKHPCVSNFISVLKCFL